MDLFQLSDARLILREFVKLQPGESCTVLFDHPRRAEADAVSLAAQEISSEVVMVDISQTVAALLTSDEFWTAPPSSVVAAIEKSKVTVTVLDENYGFRLDHKLRSLVRTGPDCSLYKVDLGLGTWRLSRDDIAEAQRIENAILAKMAAADRIHVTSANGTDVSLSIRGHACLPVTVIPQRGLPYAIPVPLWGEYNWAPLAGSVNGTIVIDGITEATSTLHVVSEPVTWTVVDDRIVDVSGGRDADDFRRVFSLDDGASLIGELGIGGNPKAIPGTETEKALFGTVHFGVGQNDEYPGGEVRSVIHVDGVVRGAKVTVDGSVLIENGRLAVDPSAS